MSENGTRSIVGVLGGMGPLASAEFLSTIYEYSLGDREQLSPRVLLLSDPSFPDRTEEFLAGACDNVLDRLIGALRLLRQSGASRIVICCMTIHYLLPRLPDDLRQQIVSLLDVIFEHLARTQKRHLLICSNGTRKLGLFESHSRWDALKDRIVWPDESDQNIIHHDMIYEVKKNCDVSTMFPFLESLLAKYEVDSFIAGCSEIHLLGKRFVNAIGNQKGYGALDPLAIIARGLADEFK
jgi:aspartate racemase